MGGGGGGVIRVGHCLGRKISRKRKTKNRRRKRWPLGMIMTHIDMSGSRRRGERLQSVDPLCYKFHSLEVDCLTRTPISANIGTFAVPLSTYALIFLI